jgi:signal transduction histidine kinase
MRDALLRLYTLMLILIATPPVYANTTSTAPPGNPLAGTPVVLTDDTTSELLGLYAMILEDPSQERRFEDISSESGRGDFQPSTKAIPGFGFRSSAFWLKWRIDNQSKTSRKWLLDFAYSPMQQIDVHIVTNKGNGNSVRTHHRSGSATPLAERPIAYRTHLFPLTLPPGESAHLYIRVAGSSSKTMPVIVWHPDHFSRQSASEFYMAGTYLGVLTALACFSLFLSSFIRESMYVLYASFLVSTMMFFLSLYGISQIYLWGNLPWLSIPALPASMAMVAIFANTFSTRFLGINLHTPRLDRFLKLACTTGFFILLLCWFIPYHITIITGTLLSISSATPLIVSATLAYRRGNEAAKYYLVAWSTFLLGIATQALRLFGVLPSTALTEYAIFVGSAFEAILLTVALAARIKMLNEAKFKAQQEIIQQSQIVIETINNQSRELEALVDERRKELETAQQEVVSRQKMAALGVMSEGISASILEPNRQVARSLESTQQVIQEFRQYLSDLAEGDAEVGQQIDRRFHRIESQHVLIQEGRARIQTIIQGLGMFGQAERKPTRACDPVTLCCAAIERLAGTTAKGTILEIHPGASPTMHCWPDELVQGALHVVDNAIQAIRTREGETPGWSAGRVEVTTSMAMDHPETLVIVIEDNGCGMAQEIVDKAFDPFFTTRAVGAGTGLGLSTTRDIVSRHGGHITLKSSEYQGTRVTIELPVR